MYQKLELNSQKQLTSVTVKFYILTNWTETTRAPTQRTLLDGLYESRTLQLHQI